VDDPEELEMVREIECATRTQRTRFDMQASNDSMKMTPLIESNSSLIVPCTRNDSRCVDDDEY